MRSSTAAPLFAIALFACSSPTTPSASASAKSAAPSSATPPVATSAASASAAPAESALAAASGSAPPAASAAEPPGDPLASPRMVGDDGKPLPQTEDKPSAESAAFQRRAALLFEAIKKDDPSIAEPSFFPKSAYVQVKDIPKAEKDWESRLWRLFKRDVHEYHKDLGKDPEQAEYVGVTTDDKHMKWMKPASEGNRIGYFRAFGTTLTYKNAKGKERKLGVTSIISWRGEWFVVHLHGTK